MSAEISQISELDGVVNPFLYLKLGVYTPYTQDFTRDLFFSINIA